MLVGALAVDPPTAAVVGLRPIICTSTWTMSPQTQVTVLLDGSDDPRAEQALGLFAKRPPHIAVIQVCCGPGAKRP